MSHRQSPRRGGQERRGGLKTRRGFTHLELIASIVVLGAGVIGLAGTATQVVRTPPEAAAAEFWAAIQTVGDSLQQRGHGGVTAGSRVVGNYTFQWTVDASNARLDRVTLAGWSAGPDSLSETVLLYLADDNAP